MSLIRPSNHVFIYVYIYVPASNKKLLDLDVMCSTCTPPAGSCLSWQALSLPPQAPFSDQLDHLVLDLLQLQAHQPGRG